MACTAAAPVLVASVAQATAHSNQSGNAASRGALQGRFAGVSVSAPVVRLPSRAGVSQTVCHAEEESGESYYDMDTKAFRRALNKDGNYNRQGFGYKQEMLEKMNKQYESGLIQRLKENNFTLTQGEVTIELAKSYGFCWGVERAVQMAYETRKHFPTQKIWITNEIIHNPTVNQKLRDMEIGFIPVRDDGEKDFSVVANDNVVVLPAFGASVQEMQLLSNKGVNIVDTTCPWVSKVWNTVEKHKKTEYTSIIHGKYAHEETVATASFAGTYLIIKDMKEAEYACDYILGGKLNGKSGTKEDFLKKFAKAISRGFDPDKDLDYVGMANQTTMLKGETEMIGKLFETSLMTKFGPQSAAEHFMAFNTICDATQERQDAMFELVDKPLDLMLVVGGYNSSNTSHLQEIAEERKHNSFWVDSADRIDVDKNEIQHLLHYGELVTTKDWLKPGPIRVGVTSGASTPDKVG
eukprot:jgi/Mesvir1/27605/Mv07341-RA.1